MTKLVKTLGDVSARLLQGAILGVRCLGLRVGTGTRMPELNLGDLIQHLV